MAKTIGTPTRGILLQDAIDTRDIPDPDISRELERNRALGEQVTQRTEYSAYLGKGLKWYTNPQSSGIAYDSATDAINAQRMASIVNDDDITIDKKMVEVINDPSTKVVDGQVAKVMPTGRDVIRRSGQFARSSLLLGINPDQSTQGKRKRKKSKYSKELSRQLKMLVKKHPRTPVIKLMKRAHRATKKALK